MKKSNDILWGLFFILLAIIYLGNELNIFPKIEYKIVFILIFSLCFITSLFKKKVWSTLVSGAILYRLSYGYLHLPYIDISSMFITVLLLGIGFSMIFPRKKIIFENHDYQSKKKSNSFIKEDVVFSNRTRYLDLSDFKNAKFDCVFSNLKLYMDQCTIEGDQATIKIDSAFSSITIYIPHNWEVIGNINNVFSSKNIDQSQSLKTKKLYLNGDIVFGSIHVIYM